MFFRPVNLHSRTFFGCPGVYALAVIATALAVGIPFSRAAQNEYVHTKSTTLPELVRRINAVLHDELAYVDPPAFPAVREELVHKDRQRLVKAFEKYVVAPLGADFAKQSTSEKAMRLLRILDGIPRIDVNDFIDDEIVLVDESRKHLTNLLEGLGHLARKILEDLPGPSQLVVTEELVLRRIAGPQNGEFYATHAPCSHGTVQRILGGQPQIDTDANPAKTSAKMMSRPLTSVNFSEAQRLAVDLSETVGITLRLPSVAQARALNIDDLALWTRTPWSEQSEDNTELIRYGVDMRTVADVGGVMGEQDFFPQVPFGHHPRLGMTLVSPVFKVRELWMKQLQERIKP